MRDVNENCEKKCRAKSWGRGARERRDYRLTQGVLSRPSDFSMYDFSSWRPLALLYSSSSEAKTGREKYIFVQCSFRETAKEVLRRRRQRRQLVKILAASVGVNLKVTAKISDAEFQPRIYRYVFDVGDHPTAAKCLPIVAGIFRVNVRFQVKVRFNLSNGRQQGQAQWIHIHWIVLFLGRCCWAAKSLSRLQSGSRRKALPNKTLDKLKSF